MFGLSGNGSTTQTAFLAPMKVTNMEMNEKRLGAIFYHQAQGMMADSLLMNIADRLREQGLKLAGAVQLNTNELDRCRCDMSMRDLSTGKIIEISQYRGPQARGCRLDQQALEETVGLVRQAVDHGADFLIVNKFGKREAVGHGFRQVIEAAIARDIPVLLSVGPETVNDWREYTGDLAKELPHDLEAVLAWCGRVSSHPRTDAISLDNKASFEISASTTP